jgi:hypothetical protein
MPMPTIKLHMQSGQWNDKARRHGYSCLVAVIRFLQDIIWHDFPSRFWYKVGPGHARAEQLYSLILADNDYQVDTRNLRYLHPITINIRRYSALFSHSFGPVTASSDNETFFGSLFDLDSLSISSFYLSSYIQKHVFYVVFYSIIFFMLTLIKDWTRLHHLLHYIDRIVA